MKDLSPYRPIQLHPGEPPQPEGLPIGAAWIDGLGVAPACPFCGGVELRLGAWGDGADESYAVECIKCLASAPASVWPRRVPI